MSEPVVIREKYWNRVRDNGPFEVDGLTYVWPGTPHVRPMIELIHDDRICGYPSFLSGPQLTEEELDHWVRTGRFEKKTIRTTVAMARQHLSPPN